MPPALPKLYTDHAAWFHLLTAPEEYAEESAFYMSLLREASGAPVRSLLELGSGGGNMASHYVKELDEVVLSDLSAQMIALSRTIHPNVEHHVADMCNLRLGRTFDAVFVHDAVVYLLTEHDLRRAMQTAWEHLKPGGVAVFAPDHVAENYRGGTDHGGNDGDGRGLRYLEWCHPARPGADHVLVDYALIFHEDGQPPRVDVDRHLEGLFSREVWLRLLAEVGFRAHPRLLEHSEVEPDEVEVFVAVRPA